jgi:hypothetical protein
MGKKFFGAIIICAFWLSLSPAFAITIKKVVVLPVDIPSAASSYSIYPNTLSLVSADIANSLLRDYGMEVLDVNQAQKILMKAGMFEKYKGFVRLYKDKYVLDNDLLKKIATTLGVENIVFVSGGFDTRQVLFKESLGYKLNLPWADTLSPSYKLNLTVTLINANNAIKLYEGNFQKDFKMENFDIPSQSFGENAIPVNKIKHYSQKLMPEISYQINDKVQLKEYNNTGTFQDSAELKTKDGSTTKDGLKNFEQIIVNRKNNYQRWILRQL